MGSRLRTSGCGDSKPMLGMNFISEARKTLKVFGRGCYAPNICWSVLNASEWEAQQGSNSGSIPNNYGNLFPFLNFFSKFLTCKMALTLALLSSQGSCKAQIRCESLCIEKHEAPYMVIEHPKIGLTWVICANICQIFIQIQGTIHRPRTRGVKLASRCDNTRNRWGFPGDAVVENPPANAGDTGSSPSLGRSHMLRRNWAREPQLLSLRVWSLCSATREAAIVRGPRTAMKSGPRLPQLEKALAQKRRPNTAKNK